MTRLVCRPFRLINSFDHHGSLHVLFVIKIIQLLLSSLLWWMQIHVQNRSKKKGTIIDAQIMCSKCMPSVITAPLCMKFHIDLAAPCCVCPTLHSPILPIVIKLILQQSTMKARFFKVMMICMTSITVQLARLMAMTAVVCVIPVTAMSPPPLSKVLVPMEIQRSSSMDWAEWI